MSLQILEDRVSDHILRIHLVGALDNETAAALETRLTQALDSHETRILMDLTRLERVTSAGLRVLMLAAKQNRSAGGRIVFLGLSKEVAQVFKMTGLMVILGVFDDLPAAVAAIDAPSGAGF